jgi:hypothetical protein
VFDSFNTASGQLKVNKISNILTANTICEAYEFQFLYLAEVLLYGSNTEVLLYSSNTEVLLYGSNTEVYGSNTEVLLYGSITQKSWDSFIVSCLTSGGK